MKGLLSRILKRFNNRLKALMRSDLLWLIYVRESRLGYTLGALHSGVLMNRGGKANLYNLRRSIHRIEKGLSHRKPRDSFAEDYIFETIKYLEQVKSLATPDRRLIDWSEAVLDKYFEVCTHTEKVAQAHRLYQSLDPQNRQSTWCPYPEKQRPELAVSYDAFHQLALRRRSVRYYIDRTVEFDVIRRAMEVALLSPSACNRQCFKFLFYNDQDMVNRISEIPGGVSGYRLPSIVVVVGRYRGYFDERDINAPIIDSSLAVMSFLFALETLGLSSVCINWPNLPDREKRIRRLIQLEDDEFIVVMIGVGYPDPEGKIPFSAKRDVDELVFLNEKHEGTEL